MLLKNNAVRNFGINRRFFCLLLSDAAKYMIAADNRTKISVSQAVSRDVRSTLITQLCYEIKSHFEDEDQLIAKIKVVTIKNKTSQAKFSALAYRPQPVPT